MKSGLHKQMSVVFIVLLLVCAISGCEEKETFKITGESDSAFIKESKPYSPLEGLISDEDRDWIDVDGLRNIHAGNAALIDDTNRDWIGKETTNVPIVVQASEIPKVTEEEAKAAEEKAAKERIERVVNNDFIDSIADVDSRLPQTVNPFCAAETENGYQTPEVIFGNGAMIIFTKPDGSGWNLKKGERLVFTAEQYPLEKKRTGTDGQKIIFGYIFEKELFSDLQDVNMKHHYVLPAKKEGEYYMTIMNSDSIITLKEGTIEVK